MILVHFAVDFAIEETKQDSVLYRVEVFWGLRCLRPDCLDFDSYLGWIVMSHYYRETPPVAPFRISIALE